MVFLSHEYQQWWERVLGGSTHHDSGAQADNLAPYGARHDVPIANGQECDGYQPQCICEVSRGVDSLPTGKGNLVLKPQPGGALSSNTVSLPAPLLTPRNIWIEGQKFCSLLCCVTSLRCSTILSCKVRIQDWQVALDLWVTTSWSSNNPFTGAAYEIFVL